MDEGNLSVNELLDGEITFSELRDMGEDEALYDFMNSKVEPEIDHEEGRIRIDPWSTAREIELEDGEPTYEIQKRSGVGYLLAPIDLFGDIPTAVGRITAGKNMGEDEAKVEGVIGGVGEKVSLGVLGYDLVAEAVNIPDVPEAYIIPALAGYGTGVALKGRSEAIQEDIVDEYLDELEAEAGDYTFETLSEETGYRRF